MRLQIVTTCQAIDDDLLYFWRINNLQRLSYRRRTFAETGGVTKE
jgi:hypothetical protein